MTITDNFIISQVWELANMDPNTTGGKTGSQTRAFRLLLVTHGGVEFIARRPQAELAELGRRGICPANLSVILGKLVGVELQRRQGLIDISAFKAEVHRLIGEAARPGNSVTSGSGTEEASRSKNPASRSKNPAGAGPVSRSAHAPGKRQKACSRNR